MLDLANVSTTGFGFARGRSGASADSTGGTTLWTIGSDGTIQTNAKVCSGGACITYTSGTSTSAVGQEGTAPSSIPAGDGAYYWSSTGHCFDLINASSVDIGCAVGATGTQTLTNKSIAGSEINSSTVGATYGGTGQDTQHSYRHRTGSRRDVVGRASDDRSDSSRQRPGSRHFRKPHGTFRNLRLLIDLHGNASSPSSGLSVLRAEREQRLDSHHSCRARVIGHVSEHGSNSLWHGRDGHLYLWWGDRRPYLHRGPRRDTLHHHDIERNLDGSLKLKAILAIVFLFTVASACQILAPILSGSKIAPIKR